MKCIRNLICELPVLMPYQLKELNIFTVTILDFIDSESLKL